MLGLSAQAMSELTGIIETISKGQASAPSNSQAGPGQSQEAEKPGIMAQVGEAIRTGDAEKGNNVGNKAEQGQQTQEEGQQKSSGAFAQMREAMRTGDAEKGNNVGNKPEQGQPTQEQGQQKSPGAMAKALEALRTGNAEAGNSLTAEPDGKEMGSSLKTSTAVPGVGGQGKSGPAIG